MKKGLNLKRIGHRKSNLIRKNILGFKRKLANNLGILEVGCIICIMYVYVSDYRYL